MVTVVAFTAFGFVIGYLIGCTRSRDRLPRELYDRNGKRLF